MDWINVKDKLPELRSEGYGKGISRRILATDGEDLRVCRFYERFTNGLPAWQDTHGYEFDGVTHWTPAPELPDSKGVIASSNL